ADTRRDPRGAVRQLVPLHRLPLDHRIGRDRDPHDRARRQPMRYVGTSVQRVEDDRLLNGNGNYIADFTAPGFLHAAFLRAPPPPPLPVASAAAAARALRGVVAVITGPGMAVSTTPLFGLAMSKAPPPPPYQALATDRVRHVGDPVALVVAESRYVAEDAVE